jgi:hypothetical protein
MQNYCQSFIMRQISNMSRNLVTGRPSAYYTVPNKLLLSRKIGVLYSVFCIFHLHSMDPLGQPQI